MGFLVGMKGAGRQGDKELPLGGLEPLPPPWEPNWPGPQDPVPPGSISRLRDPPPTVFLFFSFYSRDTSVSEERSENPRGLGPSPASSEFPSSWPGGGCFPTDPGVAGGQHETQEPHQKQEP